MILQEACKILNVNPNVSIEELRKIRNIAIRKCHPDLLKGKSELEAQVLLSKAQEINAAYDVVIEHKKKVPQFKSFLDIQKEEAIKKIKLYSKINQNEFIAAINNSFTIEEIMDILNKATIENKKNKTNSHIILLSKKILEFELSAEECNKYLNKLKNADNEDQANQFFQEILNDYAQKLRSKEAKKQKLVELNNLNNLTPKIKKKFKLQLLSVEDIALIEMLFSIAYLKNSIKETGFNIYKKQILIEVIEATYQKFGENQVECAITNYSKRNVANFFSRENGMRNKVTTNIPSNEIEELLLEILIEREIIISNDLQININNLLISLGYSLKDKSQKKSRI